MEQINTGHMGTMPPEIAAILNRILGGTGRTGSDLVTDARTASQNIGEIHEFGEQIADLVEEAEGGSVRLRSTFALGLMDIGTEVDPGPTSETCERASQVMMLCTDAAQHLLQTCANSLHTLILQSAAGYLTLSHDVERRLVTQTEDQAEKIEEAHEAGYDEGHSAGYDEGHEAAEEEHADDE